MDFSLFFACVISVGLFIVAAVSWILSRKGKHAYEELARSATFHCLRCDSIYTAPAAAKTASCPKCGYKNSKLKF